MAKALILVLALLAPVDPARIEPYLVSCPIDNTLASATGNVRQGANGLECEHKHIWIHVVNDPTDPDYGIKTLDEPHVFWVPCTVTGEKQ